MGLRFNERGQMAIDLATEIAQQSGNRWVLPEHLVIALLRIADGAAARTLTELAVDLERLKRDLTESFDTGRPAEREPIDLDPSVRRAISLAHFVAREWGHDEIGTAELLSAILRCDRYPVAQRLVGLGVTLDRFETALRNIRVGGDLGEATLGDGLLALRERRGSLDLLALAGIDDTPLAMRPAVIRQEVAVLRHALEDAIRREPVSLVPPFALSETIAAAVQMAAERRETLSGVHIAAAVAGREGTAFARVLATLGLNIPSLIAILGKRD